MSSTKDPFVEIGAGKSVYREGEAGAEMYIIETGQVELSGKAAGPAMLGPGDFFGADFLRDGKRQATATVRENARLLQLTRNALAEVIAENPEIALGMMRRLLEQQGVQALQPAPVPVQPPPAASPPPRPVEPPPPAAEMTIPQPPAVPVARVSEPPPARAPRFLLRHIASGAVIPLDPKRSDFLVGRPDPASGVVPEVDLGPYDQNRSLSRRHARILAREGVYCLREDGATNGTFVNDERIPTGVEVAVKPGDRIRFGTIEVELVSI